MLEKLRDAPWMTYSSPLDPDNSLAFKAVPVRPRHDGWTPERQYLFIEALSQIGLVKAAAQSVGKSRTSAYQLREKDGAESFCRAWDFALTMGQGKAMEYAITRATDGILEPVFYGGKQVGTLRSYDNALLRAAISAMDRRPNKGDLSDYFDFLKYN